MAHTVDLLCKYSRSLRPCLPVYAYSAAEPYTRKGDWDQASVHPCYLLARRSNLEVKLTLSHAALRRGQCRMTSFHYDFELIKQNYDFRMCMYLRTLCMQWHRSLFQGRLPQQIVSNILRKLLRRLLARYRARADSTYGGPFHGAPEACRRTADRLEVGNPTGIPCSGCCIPVRIRCVSCAHTGWGSVWELCPYNVAAAHALAFANAFLVVSSSAHSATVMGFLPSSLSHSSDTPSARPSQQVA